MSGPTSWTSTCLLRRPLRSKDQSTIWVRGYHISTSTTCSAIETVPAMAVFRRWAPMPSRKVCHGHTLKKCKKTSLGSNDRDRIRPTRPHHRHRLSRMSQYLLRQITRPWPPLAIRHACALHMGAICSCLDCGIFPWVTHRYLRRWNRRLTDLTLIHQLHTIADRQFPRSLAAHNANYRFLNSPRSTWRIC